jgi:DNA-directed RNA polymerase specialized sigma subunit
MKAREYLGILLYLSEKIKADRERVERLKEQAQKRTSNLSPDKVQSSGSASKTADTVCEWVVIERKIADDEKKMQEIINTIELLEPYVSTVLYQRYMYDKSLSEIAREMHRSYSWVAKVHRSGVKKIQGILNERKPRD